MDGYSIEHDDLALLLIRRSYPERTDRESSIIRAWLAAHGREYGHFLFSVRIGEGQTPNADDLPGVQRSQTFSTKKRIDVLAWVGNQYTIVEAKERVTPAVLGQLLTYRQLFLEENVNADEPILVAIGRTSDPDTLRSLAANGITVYLYESAPTS